MQLGTFTANILVDGRALEEYDIVSESPTKVTCWVASEEGKSFSVQWKCHEESRVAGTKGRVHVDGLGCGSQLNSPGVLGVQDTATFSSFIGGTSTRDLKFSRIQLSDDDSLLNKQIHKSLGEISLVIVRGEMVKEPCPRPAGNRDVFVPGNDQLHERSKKATVHCVGFGPEKPRRYSRYKRRLIRNSEPEIAFVFKYQPLSVLQANGIAPRPTSTDASAGHESSSSERDVGIPQADDDRTSEDIKPAELNDRIQGLENELKRLREVQGSNSKDQKPKRIKTEDCGKRRRLFAPGEIIDLTI
ncbi:hypothetical protein OG21DRAFT_1504786 [Imleria badia]|nr:hypothetical protein OG21DRAFT_1504786 [Imleria badia]